MKECRDELVAEIGGLTLKDFEQIPAPENSRGKQGKPHWKASKKGVPIILTDAQYAELKGHGILK
jgi:hypothetical protein